MLEQYYLFEEQFLSKGATKSNASKGRLAFEEDCHLRTPFQRDRDRILHSKAFRRLKHKTQVFLSPEGDHYRTRLTHTLEVSQIARTIARALRMNEDLVEAIALGHDLGHTPFGHSGERVLHALTGDFDHAKQSLRVVDLLENKGKGLNLTFEVRNGILNHSGSSTPATLEGFIVKYADRIAYINHDIEDAITARIITDKDLPNDCIKILGKTKSDRIGKQISDIVNNSMDTNSISMTPEVLDATNKLRSFMFESVYNAKAAKVDEEKAHRMLGLIFEYYKNNYHELDDTYQKLLRDGYALNTVIADFIASMSDTYVVKVFENIYIPRKWTKF